MADLNIITLTRQHPEYVERLSDCLDAQEGVGHLKIKRILVNNGPRKGLKQWDPSTRLALQRGWAVIEPGYNTSFSEGNNLGAKAATGDYLLLLNDDMVLEPDALARLWACREKASLVGNSSPAVSGDTVVVPFPSGELIAYRISSGKPFWADSLA